MKTELIKEHFYPGDRVLLKQDIPNKPIMIVKGKEVRTILPGKDGNTPAISTLIGLKCFWFSSDGKYQEGIFNTKDLLKVGE